jgi:GDP-L-fucose synthase
LLSTAKLRKLGWEPKIGLREGIRRTYEWFLENRRVASR